MYRRAWITRDGIDRGETAALIIRDPQGLQVPRRYNVLRELTDGKLPDDLVGRWIDLINRVTEAVGHVDHGTSGLSSRAQVAGAVGRIDVAWIDDGRHAG